MDDIWLLSGILVCNYSIICFISKSMYDFNISNWLSDKPLPNMWQQGFLDLKIWFCHYLLALYVVFLSVEFLLYLASERDQSDVAIKWWPLLRTLGNHYEHKLYILLQFVDYWDGWTFYLVTRTLSVHRFLSLVCGQLASSNLLILMLFKFYCMQQRLNCSLSFRFLQKNSWWEDCPAEPILCLYFFRA